MASVATRAEDVRWDLSELAAGADDARAQIDALAEAARAFGERHRGRVAELDGPALRELLDELDELEQDASRLEVYVSSRLNLAATDPEANDLTTFSRDRVADMQNSLVFFGLEWLALDDDAAEALLCSAQLAPYAHRLRVAREEKPFVLGEAEEQALNARRGAVGAWQALHDRQVATIEVAFDGGDGEEPHNVSRLLSYVHHPEPQLRRAALSALYEGLEPRADVLAACYDALVGDRLGVDRLRGFVEPMQPTNMSNELDADIVDAMMSATEESHGIARGWFQHKARLLGLERLELADQYAPLGEARSVPWPEAVEIVETAFEHVSPRLAAIFRTSLEAGHVDAAPRAGKAGGAYCAGVSKQVLPYVLLNYTERMSDVTTLAHEFGHATHGALALERQAYRSYHTGLALAEVPSMLAELFANDFLLESESDAQTRVALAAELVENVFASIFRQVVLARFEQRAYALRREGRALSAERLSDLWLEENERYYGGSVALPEGYRVGWSYIPHFIHTRFYTYAYSFAQLVALLLHGRYREDPDAFVPRYLELLSAGGSASPAALLEPFGLDLRSADTWRAGFAQLQELVGRAEALTNS
ncbi:MAG: oligoendopeptidase [Actinomycetota bacterium]